MFESCYSPYESAHLLHERFRLPVKVFADQPYLRTGPLIEVVDVAAELGRVVLAQLAPLPAAPVVTDPREQRWIFLVAPPTPYHPVPVSLQRRLRQYATCVPAPGSRVMLPRSDGRDGWHWACEPEPGAMRLPRRWSVLHAVRLAILGGADHVSA
ncbi:hypothetical protein [Nocardia stercoris]|uniref:hypothetical protein n=1 Tax=Nocardia stercoris TaxID=2483361 RepID=UPI0011C420B8|nr:hypothetical protein [Nocardia stercoris]